MAYLAAKQSSPRPPSFRGSSTIAEWWATANWRSRASWAGRAYALSGDRVKAKNAYRKFIDLWKNADPDVPP
jgi:hypothetical protein